MIAIISYSSANIWTEITIPIPTDKENDKDSYIVEQMKSNPLYMSYGPNEIDVEYIVEKKRIRIK